MQPLLLLLALLFGCPQSHAQLATCFDNMPTAPPPLADELPLCGNGILDTGELCDDGNRVAGDGCNAFCSAFDAMTAACTLAGQSNSCPFGKPQLGAPAQTTFCNLRALDAGPDGTYVILADMGTLLRYDLYVDNAATSITRLAASTTFNIQPICSLAVLPPDGAIMIHECENTQRIRLVSANGQTATLLADLHTTLLQANAFTFRAYYEKDGANGATTVIAAESLVDTASCVQIWTITTKTATTLLAEIPCIVYNVWSAGVIYPSYSIVGMHPRSITKESCPRRMQQTGSAFCYALTMQRNDMNVFTVYVHVEGGIDIGYQLNANSLDTALGMPITRTLDTQTYTATGACFMMDSRILTKRGTSPPTVTLGNACRNVPTLGWPCATPLNNPFVTDVLSSPYLLPQGLSVTHTHTELSAIFSASCPSFDNASGPLLYRGILQNTYANTTPVDFVPLPRTQDIVYITSTTVGFISAKRTQLADHVNQGYCRANNLLYCPHGFFGSVGGTCASCTDTKHPMYGRSVAWQIKCATLKNSNTNNVTGSRRLLLAQSPPFERMSMVVGGDPQDQTLITDTLTEALGQYAHTKSLPSPRDVFLTPLQQYNMAADRWTSLLLQGTSSRTLIECLIGNAENTTRRTLFKDSTAVAGAEFTSTLLSYTPGQLILHAMFSPGITQKANDSTAAQCSEAFLRKDPLQAWLPCVTMKKSVTAPLSRRRHLLQTSTAGVLIVEHQGTTLGSTAAVSWTAEQQPGVHYGSVTVDPPAPSPAPSSSSSATFPIWAAALIAGVGLLIVLFLVYMLYRRMHKTKS